ncbi:MAG: hypothetical protein D6811_09250 [Alphaproteobacteria bacterium]|nr:MAG: hypothetical protein D6811_09250 [Alphaproteobacteria bacterium]
MLHTPIPEDGRGAGSHSEVLGTVDTSTLSAQDVALVGYQRTRHVTRAARLAWEQGDRRPMLALARQRRDAILAGALEEMYAQYLPLRAALAEVELRPARVIDIGCGQALGDVFLERDFAPHFILVDIEESGEQYHGWAKEGAGYASLAAARAYLMANGVAEGRIRTVNPRSEELGVTPRAGDLVISTYSCGFHYPVDDYVEMMLETVAAGGAVCIDLRNRYARRGEPALSRLLEAGVVRTLFTEERSRRVLVSLR